MQTPIANPAAGLFALAGTGPTTGLFSDDSLLGGDLFSQLLTGFDTGAGQGGNQQNLPNAFGDIAPVTPQALLQAQQLSAQQKPVDVTALLQQEITPEQAKDLLADLDNGKFGEGDTGLYEQLREQLQELSEGTEPKTVAELVKTATDALPQEHAAKTAPVAAVQRAVAWFSSVLKKSDTATAANEDAKSAHANIVTDPNLQSLQASHFRTRDTADTATGEQPAQDEEKSKTKVEIIPLANTILVPQWVAAIAPEHPVAKKEEDLPEVELPAVDFGKKSGAADALANQRKDFDIAQLANAKEVATQASIHAEAKADAHAQKNSVAALDAVSDVVFNPSATGGHTQTQTTQALQPISTVSLPHGVVNHAPVSEQVHVAMSKAAKDGIEHITIQLDPAHLGRVEINMHVDRDGTTQITFLADKAETFDALSRDAHTLERTLQEAGIKADAGSMQFNLRQQPNQQQMGADVGQDGSARGQQHSALESDSKIGEVSALNAPITRHYTVNVQDGVDIHA